MELKTTREPVFLNEMVYDNKVEQGVELDYVLPDYYPDIVRVLKSSLVPCITSYEVSGGQLYYDGIVYIKVLYLGADGNKVNCVDRRYTYSKTIDLSKTTLNKEINLSSENLSISITPKIDYHNCRAVSGRRIDIRGTVSDRVKVMAISENDMITEVSEMGMQTLKSKIRYCKEKLVASRKFVTREDIETGAGENGIKSIIHYDTVATVTDFKVVAGKVIVKGEALIKALYLKETSGGVVVDNDTETSGDTNGYNAEVMEAVIPISQIVELNGVTEAHSCFVNLSVMDCSLEVKTNDSTDSLDEGRILSCDLTVDCSVAAHLEGEALPVVDMYCIDYESSFEKQTLRVETMPQMLDKSLSLRGAIECNETTTGSKGKLETVYDARCDISDIGYTIRKDGDTLSNELIITGRANMHLVGKLDNNTPVFIEKQEIFELSVGGNVLLDNIENTDDFVIEPSLQVVNLAYSISPNGDDDRSEVELRISLRLNGCLYRINSIDTIKEITINEDLAKSKDNDYALKLYYAENGERVWDIAKRYNTSMDIILSENDLEGDNQGDNDKQPQKSKINLMGEITSPCMLFIPIV